MQGRRCIFCYFYIDSVFASCTAPQGASLHLLFYSAKALFYIYFCTARKRFSTFTFVQPRRGFFLPLHNLHELLMELFVREWRGVFDFGFIGIDGVDGVVE